MADVEPLKAPKPAPPPTPAVYRPASVTPSPVKKYPALPAKSKSAGTSLKSSRSATPKSVPSSSAKPSRSTTPAPVQPLLDATIQQRITEASSRAAKLLDKAMERRPSSLPGTRSSTSMAQGSTAGTSHPADAFMNVNPPTPLMPRLSPEKHQVQEVDPNLSVMRDSLNDATLPSEDIKQPDLKMKDDANHLFVEKVVHEAMDKATSVFDQVQADLKMSENQENQKPAATMNAQEAKEDATAFAAQTIVPEKTKTTAASFEEQLVAMERLQERMYALNQQFLHRQTRLMDEQTEVVQRQTLLQMRHLQELQTKQAEWQSAQIMKLQTAMQKQPLPKPEVLEVRKRLDTLQTNFEGFLKGLESVKDKIEKYETEKKEKVAEKPLPQVTVMPVERGTSPMFIPPEPKTEQRSVTADTAKPTPSKLFTPNSLAEAVNEKLSVSPLDAILQEIMSQTQSRTETPAVPHMERPTHFDYASATKLLQEIKSMRISIASRRASPAKPLKSVLPEDLSGGEKTLLSEGMIL